MGKKRVKSVEPRRELMTGNTAAAHAVRLCNVDVIPAFPITPQTEIIEDIAQWKADGEIDAEFIRSDSEHSVLSSAVGSQASGSRTFTATSSQGLLLMHEILYIASGLRLPMVMVNVSRGLSAPITLWTDFNDILDQRDSGWIILFAQDNQETLDSIIQAYKVAEDERVLCPSIVNMEGFIHSYTREPVSVPSQEQVKSFLPSYKPATKLDPEEPKTLGPVVMEEYMSFRNQQHLALKNALSVIEEVQKDFEEKFGRKYEVVETYKIEDADVAILTIGSIATTGKHCVNRLREKGKKVGLIRIRVYRPWPEEELKNVLKKLKGVAVIDRNIAPGKGGIIFDEVRSTAHELDVTLNSFIAGLGGKSISEEDFEYMIEKTFEDLEKNRSRVEWIELQDLD